MCSIEFKWNSEGAFIGRLSKSEDCPYICDVGPLPYAFILVVPLLDIKKKDSVRFTDPDTYKNWQERKMASAMSTFVHYAFLESDRTLVFSDLQGE